MSWQQLCPSIVNYKKPYAIPSTVRDPLLNGRSLTVFAMTGFFYDIHPKGGLGAQSESYLNTVLCRTLVTYKKYLFQLR